MGRGFGAKPARTKKCECDNPSWSVWELRDTSNGELVITFDCSSCKALWDTKSRDMRKRLNPDAVYKRYNSGSIVYIRDMIKKADDTRRDILVNTIKNNNERIAELQAASKKAQKELDMLNEQMELAIDSWREITLFVHGGLIFTQPSYIRIGEVAAYLLELEALAMEKLEATGAEHVVYAVKTFKDGKLVKLDAYMEPMDDATFHERTTDEAKGNPGCEIYALHNNK